MIRRTLAFAAVAAILILVAALFFLIVQEKELEELEFIIQILDEGQTTNISCTLFNPTDKLLVIEYPNPGVGGTYQYFLTHPDGTVQSLNFPAADPTPMEPLRLGPNESYQWNLSFSPLGPGEYKLYLKYMTKAESESDLNGLYLEGYVISNEIVFTVG